MFIFIINYLKFNEYIKYERWKIMEKIILRAVTIEDANDLFEYGKDSKVTQFVSWDTYLTKNDARNSIETVFLNQPYSYAIVYCQENKMIGTISLVKYENEVGYLGYCLNQNYWNKGIMSVAINKFLQLLKKDNFKLIYTEVINENLSSIKCLQKNDFIIIKDIMVENKEAKLLLKKLDKEVN